jgi:hypothetical protein
MRVIENRCCDCAVPSYPCRGVNCELKNYEAVYCDYCGEEIGEQGVFNDEGDFHTSCYEEMNNEEGE